MDLPLEGLRVLEHGDAVATRYAGRLFAMLGAEVIRPALANDDGIGFGGRAGLAFGRWLDERKHVADPGGALFDFVLGGPYRPDVSKAAADAKARAATLVALTWFDLEGPYGDWRGADEIVTALAGGAFLFGEAAGPPMLPQGHGPQITAGVVGFIGAMASLFGPRRAERVEVNVLEAALCYAENGALGAQRGGQGASRIGVNRFVPTYPCAPYRASDGWVGITCLTPAQWKALCRLVGRLDMADDPRFAATLDRLLLAEAVDDALAPAIAERTQAEWVALGVSHRIPITPMQRPGELADVDHWRARGAFAPVAGMAVRGPTLPYRMSFDGVTSPEPRSTTPGKPLVGLRVADFSMGWAGPLCARTLGDLGADVVKVESESHQDWWRGWEAGSDDTTARESHFNFINVNRNKRGVDFDLTAEEGRARAAALIASADVVVENYAAGVLEKLGLGQDVQRRLRPGVISLSMPAFGNGGPLSGLRAYGSTVEQASGLPFVNGEAAWPPAQQHVALGDPIAGLYGAGAILAALYGRSRLGGAEIDMAQVACLFQIGADAILAEEVMGGPAPRTGHARARLNLCAVVEAQAPNTWVAVAAPDAASAARLSQTVDGEGLAALQSWARSRPVAEAVSLLQAAGVPAAPVNPAAALLADPQLAGRYFLEMDRAVVGSHLVAAAAFMIDGVRPSLERPAPLLGEHTSEVTAELSAAQP